MSRPSGNPSFLGKFRGTVSDNQDPNGLGRIKAQVPDVFGRDTSGWALPAVPYAGDGVGTFLLPPTGAAVWIEFEHGDPDYPIWSGCFWAQGEPPLSPASPDKKVIKTATATVTLDDTSGAEAVIVESSNGQKITLDANGVTIDNGDSTTVKLNGAEIVLETSGGQKLKLAASGIELDNGNGATVKLSGPKVEVNGGALEVV